MPLIPLLLLGLLLGCATPPSGPASDDWPDTATACLEEFEALDAEIEQAAARDHGAFQPDGWPWLRSTRLLASIGEQLASSDQANPDDWEDWLSALSAVDADSRRWELANLNGLSPKSNELGYKLNKLDECREGLNQALLDQPAELRKIAQAAQVPDEYRTAWRWAGVYPISRLFVLAGVNRLHADQKDALEGSTWPRRGGWREYLARPEFGEDFGQPPYSAADIPPEGLVLPDSQEIAALFSLHAPVWRIEEAGEHDRIGSPAFDADGKLQINTAEPVEFRYLSHTRFGDEVFLQLNYMVWFPERPPESRFDLLAGEYDGAIWRVTLNQNQEVIAGESLHVCGCYYMVFPGEGVEPAEQARGGEPIFVGPRLPKLKPGERLRLSRESGNHYLVRVDRVKDGMETRTALGVADANSLRSLEHPEGRRGVYGERGLVPGSERAERYLLWTMGVPSPGALRQPGRHAIAFAGRRHFDDPWILQESLVSESGE